MQLNNLEAYHLLHNGNLALARAERAGIRVDIDYLERKQQQLTNKIDRLDAELRTSKFWKDWKRSLGNGDEPNLNSPVQLRKYLYKVRGRTPPKLTDTGEGSTDKEALQELRIKELDIILRIRNLQKIRDTYLESFKREQVDGYIHPIFNLHLPRTFRSSSDHPNFQNIPKRDKEAMKITRGALYPRLGHQLLEADYSGLEVRIAACYHKDSTMLKYLKTGYDLHEDMTKDIFKINDFDKHKETHAYLRSATKNGFVFPQFYGSYFRNCAYDLACKWGDLSRGRWKPGTGVQLDEQHLADHFIANGIRSLDQFEKHIEAIETDFWTRRFREYDRWKERWWKEYQKKGYVDMLTGFRCSGVMDRKDVINYPIQGAAFHCLLWSFIELDRYLRVHNFRSRIIGQIHDSIVLDVHPAELNQLVRVIKHITTTQLPEAWPWIIVPLEVEFEVCDVDAPWSEKKELKIF